MYPPLNTYREIQPLPYVTPQVKAELVAFRIDQVQVQPNSSAYWNAIFVTPTGQELSTVPVSISGDEYSAWGTDDEYLYTITMKKLGLTPKSALK